MQLSKKHDQIWPFLIFIYTRNHLQNQTKIRMQKKNCAASIWPNSPKKESNWWNSHKSVGPNFKSFNFFSQFDSVKWSQSEILRWLAFGSATLWSPLVFRLSEVANVQLVISVCLNSKENDLFAVFSVTKQTLMQLLRCNINVSG